MIKIMEFSSLIKTFIRNKLVVFAVLLRKLTTIGYIFSILQLQSAIQICLSSNHSSSQLSVRKDNNSSTTRSPYFETQISQNQCYCMESFNCTLSGGEIYSYCGTSGESNSEVCCLLTNQIKNNSILNNVSKSVLKPHELVELLQSSSSKQYLIEENFQDHNHNTMNDEACGTSINNGIVDSIAQFKEWPWHVAILEARDDLYMCGGSFLQNQNGSQLILTAGHCVSKYVKSLQRLKVRLGEYDVSTNSEPIPYIELLVQKIILHPEYSNSNERGLQNDIAILKLNNSIQLRDRDNIQPICLPEDEVSNSTLLKCVVTGWGRKHEYSKHSVVLKEIHVPIWQHKACEKDLRNIFGPSFRLSSKLICAGDNQGNDACDGDGGGPLVCFENTKWVQQGLVSWGVGCGRNPGMYTKISSYTNWIKSLF